MKRLFLSLAILGVCSIGIFAQENEMKKNSVGFSFTLFGAELHYERNFNNYLSVLGSVSYTTIFIVDEFTVSAKGRWYPFGKTWYLGLGAGYILGGLSDYNGGLLAGLLTASAYFPPLIIFAPLLAIGEAAEYMKRTSRESGLLIQTNLGWKIPPGRRWAVLIDTGIDFNVKGISNSIKAGIEKNTESPEGPEYLLHCLLPYLRLGFDFKF